MKIQLTAIAMNGMVKKAEALTLLILNNFALLKLPEDKLTAMTQLSMTESVQAINEQVWNFTGELIQINKLLRLPYEKEKKLHHELSVFFKRKPMDEDALCKQYELIEA